MLQHMASYVQKLGEHQDLDCQSNVTYEFCVLLYRPFHFLTYFRTLLGVHLRRALDDDAGGRGQLLHQHAPLRVPVAGRGDALVPTRPRHVPPLHGRLPGTLQYQYEHLNSV